ADLVVREPVDREVLAEVAVHEVVTTELLLPVAGGVQLIDQHRALLSAVAGEVALPGAVAVQPPPHAARCGPTPPPPRRRRPPAPGHVLRQSDAHRHQCRRPSTPQPVAYHAGGARTTRRTERGATTGRTSAARSRCSRTDVHGLRRLGLGAKAVRKRVCSGPLACRATAERVVP